MRSYPLALILTAALCACSPSDDPKATKPPPPPAAPAPPKPVALAPPTQVTPVAGGIDPTSLAAPSESDNPTIMAINAADFTVTPPGAKSPKTAKSAKATTTKAAFDPLLVRAEALLARARFSPGVVDGKDGTNFKHALAAYRTARGIDVDGELEANTLKALLAETGADRPVTHAYAISAADIAGPFAPDVGEDFVKLAAQTEGPRFATPLEALAERFHMSQSLLTALNPDVDFKTAGANLVVVDAEPPAFQKGDVASVQISKADASATAMNKAGEVIAFYPATVGSTDRPSPSGVHKVNGVARNPDYTYDPKKLAWGPRAAGKLTVKAGPNNPVGTVWIDLNAPSYGIHGSPDPDKIGKTGSHGCVRLTNWDAEALAAGVKPGVQVAFVGIRKAAAKTSSHRV